MSDPVAAGIGHIQLRTLVIGVVAKERSDPPPGEVLRRWFEDRVLPAFAGRVLPFDLPATRILANYRVPNTLRSTTH